jgi:hypothetical protein
MEKEKNNCINENLLADDQCPAPRAHSKKGDRASQKVETLTSARRPEFTRTVTVKLRYNVIKYYSGRPIKGPTL